MSNYSHTFSHITARRAEALHKTCDIVNLERYNVTQLLRTHSAIVEKNPETLEKLRSGNVTVVFTDAYDLNGANDHAPTLFDSEHTLVFEIKQPRDIVRHFAQLRRLGIKPATVVMGLHGLEGALNVAGTLITSDMIRDSHAVALIADECMQPHSETGERLLVLDSCLGAAGGQNATGYVMAKTSKREQRLVVRAFSDEAYVDRRVPSDGSGFQSKRRSVVRPGKRIMRPARVVEYRHTQPPKSDRIIVSKRTPGRIK